MCVGACVCGDWRVRDGVCARARVQAAAAACCADCAALACAPSTGCGGAACETGLVGLHVAKPPDSPALCCTEKGST
eukprot:scaffold19009_cov98-Isochrysis_galbana.AAC.5